MTHNEEFAPVNDLSAAVYIGDKAIQNKGNYKYVYDLAEEWYKMTGLGFIFAVWSFKSNIEPDFINNFHLALQNGIENKSENIEKWSKLFNMTPEYIEEYFNKYIEYQINDKLIKGFQMYLKMLAEIENKLFPEIKFI